MIDSLVQIGGAPPAPKRPRLPEWLRRWQAVALAALRRARAFVQRLGLHHLGDALMDRLGTIEGDFVELARGDERRHADLAEVGAAFPILDDAGDGEFVRAVQHAIGG